MAVRRLPYLKPAEVWTTRESAMFSAFSDQAGRRVFTGKPVHYIDQLGMRGTGWIAEFLYRMSIGELTQADELEDPLPPVKRQFGWPAGKQNMPELPLAEQMVEFARRHIDQEQNEDPKLDCNKTIPGEGRDHMRKEAAHWIVLDEPEPDEMFEQASNEYNGPIEH